MEEGSESQQLNNKNLDQILQRIGFGRAHYMAGVLAGIAVMADGMELTLLGLLTTILEDEWDLSTLQLGFMAGVVFIGMVIGAGISAITGDQIGRIILLKASLIITFISGVASAFMPEYWSFILMRMFVGLGIGLGIPVAVSYVTEICPSQYRGAYMISFQLFFCVGQVLIIGCAFILTPDLDGGNWRWLVIIASAPLSVDCILIFWLKESPFFLARKQKHEECIESLNYLAQINQTDPLDAEEEEIVRSIAPQHQDQIGFDKVKVLFDEQHYHITWKLMIIWCVAISVVYGLLVLIPESYGSDDDTTVLLTLMCISLATIPAVFINMAFVESEKLGRKWTIIIFLGIQSVMFGVCVIVSGSWLLIVALSIVYFCASSSFNALYPYTSEVFETEIRSLSNGFFNLVSRSVGAFAPTVLLVLNEFAVVIPYIILTGLSILSFIVAMKLPLDTRRANLDTVLGVHDDTSNVYERRSNRSYESIQDSSESCKTKDLILAANSGDGRGDSIRS